MLWGTGDITTVIELSLVYFLEECWLCNSCWHFHGKRRSILLVFFPEPGACFVYSAWISRWQSHEVIITSNDNKKTRFFSKYSSAPNEACLLLCSINQQNRQAQGERKFPFTLIALCRPLPTSCEAADCTHSHDRVMWLHWLASSCQCSVWGVWVCVWVMPTHWNEKGMESTTELWKFKGKLCLY